MSRYFETLPIDRWAIEREARRLQAQTLKSGMRSIRNWTVAAFQRHSAERVS